MTAMLDAPAASSASSAARVAVEGGRDVTPMVLGVVPFAFAIGAAIGTSDLSVAQGIISGPGIYAGSAQLSTVEMLSDGAAPLIIALSALMINARLLLYSATMAKWFAGEPLRRRLLLAFPVIDQLGLLCVERFERGDLDARGRRWYYAGAAIWLGVVWTTTQTIAIVGGARLPAWLGLRVAAPLAMAGLLAKSVRGRHATIAAVTAALAAVSTASLPYNSSVLAAIMVALAVASFMPRSTDVERVR